MISEIKRQARTALHQALHEPASYLDSSLSEAVPTAEQQDAGLSLKVRWHHKLKIIGENVTADAGIIEGINRIVFNADNLAELGLELRQHGVLTIPGFDKTVRLDYLEEGDGPLNVYWSVIEL